MHEASIAEALLEEVDREVAAAGRPGRVLRVTLSIGRLSGVSPEALRFAFERLSIGTRMEGAELEIEEPRAYLACRRCGTRAETEDVFGLCPGCGSAEVAVGGGRDLRLEAIEVDAEGEARG